MEGAGPGICVCSGVEATAVATGVPTGVPSGLYSGELGAYSGEFGTYPVGEFNEADKKLIELAKSAAKAADQAMVLLDFSTGINQIRSIVDATNLYLTEQEPWKVAKDPAQNERLATILYVVAELLRIIAVLYYPVMPKSSQKLWQSLGAEKTLGDLASQLISTTFEFGKLPQGALTSKGESLFPQLLEDE